ncbi:MAG: hypothetical protein ABIH82_01125 [Candidatus Woesearchaeota archaeon]
MVKKCIICNDKAEFKIKDTPDYYCRECAEENFADLSMLIKVEEEAQRLKDYLKEKMENLAESEEELNKYIKITEKDDASDDKDRED